MPAPSIKAVLRAAPEEPIRIGTKRRRGGPTSASASKQTRVSRPSRQRKTTSGADGGDAESGEDDEEVVSEHTLEKERKDLARRGFVESTSPKTMEIIDYKTNGITERGKGRERKKEC